MGASRPTRRFTPKNDSGPTSTTVSLAPCPVLVHANSSRCSSTLDSPLPRSMRRTTLSTCTFSKGHLRRRILLPRGSMPG
jgi:hypothetical protein